MIRIKQKLVYALTVTVLLAMLAMGTAVTLSTQAGQSNSPQLIACSTGSNGSCGGG
ncbi:MAG: hypothetical protein KJ069_27455 [Anaerolineae bacterium]|nr:hypothetical protein [Anaerolineae bacterium]